MKRCDEAKRIGISFVIAFGTFILSFVVFNVVFIQWAVWRYPHNNSMAGFAAFIYGVPVGMIFAAIAFVIAFRRTGRRIAS
jgi:hypothetical protein